MADFVAVLRKTISTLGNNSPEMREKVYDKARSTIEAKLAAINPPPPAAVVDRQRKALEDAIAVVRSDYGQPPVVEQDEELEDVFASLKSMGGVTPPPTAPAARPPVPPVSVTPPPAAHEPSAAEPAWDPVAAPPPPEFDPAGDDELDAEPVHADNDPAFDHAPERDDEPGPEAMVMAARRREAEERSGSGRRTGLIAALVLLLVAAGGAYAAWLNRDALVALVSPSAPPAVVVSEEEQPDAATTAEELVQETEPEATEEEVAAAPPAAEETTPEETAPAEQPAAEAEKFTQRLMPDGSEVDDGPAGGQRTIGEGTSIATAINQQADVEANAQPEEQAEAGSEPEEQQPAAAQGGVAVGQRAIFYEERTNASQGSAEMGSIVWSVVQESPGADLPPEPAIRAEATIPANNVQLRMTIRRNGDDTLPASHIVEMIFLTPDGFEGGAIANVSRISFKDTEQAAGTPLAGIPAKIADGFFLIALGDAPQEIENNTRLLSQQSWVDIPIVYQTGRRALLSLEKGIPGERVFQEALGAWQEATANSG